MENYKIRFEQDTLFGNVIFIRINISSSTHSFKYTTCLNGAYPISTYIRFNLTSFNIELPDFKKFNILDLKKISHYHYSKEVELYSSFDLHHHYVGNFDYFVRLKLQTEHPPCVTVPELNHLIFSGNRFIRDPSNEDLFDLVYPIKRLF